ncbi:hypothetical protein [Pirellula sp. SH-Sr6A]|uniref:hypothetical protein n=1 Tax=Pirellula sp. SH-Sr6A TaxID=1632865 RepID=UPI0011BA8A4C|nr:hypothetical protein [Pirellula sp. SH-Sr6A]
MRAQHLAEVLNRPALACVELTPHPSVNSTVRQEKSMNAYSPTSRYDRRAGNRLGLLVLLVVANLSIAMVYYVRIPIGMDMRQMVVPALSAASVLLFAFSLLFSAWLAVRTPTSRLVTVLAIANGLLALAQLLVFQSSWIS